MKLMSLKRKHILFTIAVNTINWGTHRTDDANFQHLRWQWLLELLSKLMEVFKWIYLKNCIEANAKSGYMIIYKDAGAKFIWRIYRGPSRLLQDQPITEWRPNYGCSLHVEWNTASFGAEKESQWKSFRNWNPEQMPKTMVVSHFCTFKMILNMNFKVEKTINFT